MRIEPIQWRDAQSTARAIRGVVERTAPRPDVGPIAEQVKAEGDEAVLRLTGRFDATECSPTSLRVPAEVAAAALSGLASDLRASLELAAANIRTVAEAQIDHVQRFVALPGLQNVALREVPVGSAGLYAPGGRAAYPSSVLMCAIPAQVAGVSRIALASPPGPDGTLSPLALAAAALCEIDEIYAMGGAQAIFALAFGTETIAAVDVIAGPGNAWVQEAKRAAYGRVGIDSYAGPSELMLVADAETDPEWAALDLCSQAEHGDGAVLVAASTDRAVLEAIGQASERVAAAREIDPGVPLISALVPDFDSAIELANALAPEHLELLGAEAAARADGVTTAGCVFVGAYGATAFGDYVAGSNHVLPTGGAGRFSGPLGPGTFRRKIATVEVSAEAAAKLAPHVDVLARAEGFPVHGESAMIRTETS